MKYLLHLLQQFVQTPQKRDNYIRYICIMNEYRAVCVCMCVYRKPEKIRNEVCFLEPHISVNNFFALMQLSTLRCKQLRCSLVCDAETGCCLSITYSFFAKRNAYTEEKEEIYSIHAVFLCSQVSHLALSSAPYWVFWGITLKKIKNIPSQH